MKVVVVESPAKARTINKYLGNDYKVVASYGHIRDLPSKDGSVDPEGDFRMVWESEPRAQKAIREITGAVKGAETLYLATDPDREGEAISWHIREVLRQGNFLEKTPIHRVAFHEITRRAIQEAMENPRELDQGLIDAYLARRALDYLVGFTLSPVLWTKLPGSRSAGRVQSVALRLVTEKEGEIEAFKSVEYWSISALFTSNPDKRLTARLTHYQGRKLDKLDINNQQQANEIVAYGKKQSYAVSDVEKKQVKRHPAPPFITSTLQQEASRKLRFGARKTMQVAQQLYEGVDLGGEVVGLITYMRTDSVNISGEAIDAARKFIKDVHGDSYLPSSPRVYKGKAKNAQEAHEAVRPTDINLTPEKVRKFLDKDQAALYELVWKRLVASQMQSAVLEQSGIDISPPDKSIVFRATGSTMLFDGFLKLYEEGRDEETEEGERLLPSLSMDERLDLSELTPNQHFTQPPARYTEATLVKKMEELGIGRPSTYASVLSTLIDRNYVRLEKRQLIPETRGRLVSAFLKEYFPKYVEYDFTADMEEQLDEISNGKLLWKKVMETFWHDFKAQVAQTRELKITDVINMLDHNLAPYIFPADHDGSDPRKCPGCGNNTLSLKLGKFGGFVGCSNYPECNYTRQILRGDNNTEDTETPITQENNEPVLLGNDPDTEEPITLRKGPYGFYFQWGDGTKSGNKKGTGKTKPKRVALPKTLSPGQATLADALSLGALPRIVGKHPDTGEEITAALGRFGPYVKVGSSFASLAKTDNVLTVDLARALELFAIAKEKAAKKASSVDDEDAPEKSSKNKVVRGKKLPSKEVTAKSQEKKSAQKKKA